MTTEEAPVQAPTDIAGVAIHLSYLRRDLKEMKDVLGNITSNYVPINIYLEHKSDVEKRIATLEASAIARKSFEDSWAGRVWGINLTIGAVIGLAMFAANYFFK
jgi:hypothetical protein